MKGNIKIRNNDDTLLEERDSLFDAVEDFNSDMQKSINCDSSNIMKNIS